MRAVMSREVSDFREVLDDLAGRLRHPRALLGEARAQVANLETDLAGAVTSRINDEYRGVQRLSERLRGPTAMVRDTRTTVERLSNRLMRGAHDEMDNR